WDNDRFRWQGELRRMPLGFFKRFVQKVDQLVTGRGRIDEELFEELESLLIQADVNVHTTMMVLDHLKTAVQEERMADAGEVIARIKADLVTVLEQAGGPEGSRLKVAPEKPTFYLMVGVNGVGKTTTIGKLTYRLEQEGHRVILAAGDTFRAAAID